MIDVANLPGGGSLLLSVVAYAGLSYLGGQEMAERQIDKSGWYEACEHSILDDIDSRRKPVEILPEMRCDDTLGWLGRDVLALCHQFNNPDFNAPARRQEEAFNRRRQELEDRRLGRLASKAGTQCSCAANVFKAENALSLSVYAGTARLITPPEVESLQQSLNVSLGTPQCQAIAEGAK
ncbi:hypothetical protein [uncultured Roseobacter sp.]|uniref:hypothetical protein n=1 Tax=uncultured Roseobacter sp. TaxID=114847 RepID=UPI0026285B49|nr:hypothetical protein [uncultured Roseobacter sp.]